MRFNRLLPHLQHRAGVIVRSGRDRADRSAMRFPPAPGNRRLVRQYPPPEPPIPRDDRTVTCRGQTALPRPRTVGPGHGRSRRHRLWGTFARVRAHATPYGTAMLPALFLRGVPPRAPRLKAPSTRTRAKSCAIIAALGEICVLAGFPRKHARTAAAAPARSLRHPG